MWFTGKNTGMGCHALPQRVFLTQGLNPHLEIVRYHRYFRRNLKEHTQSGIVTMNLWQSVNFYRAIFDNIIPERTFAFVWTGITFIIIRSLQLEEFEMAQEQWKMKFIKGKLYRILLLFSWSVISNSCQPHGLKHTRISCLSPFPRACSNSCPLSWWCHPTISSSLIPSPPAINLSQHQGVFQRVSSSHQVAKVLEVQLQQQSFQ